MAHTVLLIDDNPVDRALYRQLLEKHFKDVAFDEAANARDGTRLLRSKRYDCVFLDHLMPDGNGLDVLRAVTGASASPIVMLTGTTDTRVAVEALKHGAVDYIMKDRVDAATIVGAMESAVVHGSRERTREKVLKHLAVLQALILQSEETLLVVDLAALKLIEASAVGLARLGHRRTDLLGRSVREVELFAANGGWDAFFAAQAPGRPFRWPVSSREGRAVETEATAQTLHVDGQPYLVARLVARD